MTEILIGQQVEDRRLRNAREGNKAIQALKAQPKRKITWELFQSTDYHDVINKAVELGWADKKVQIRLNTEGAETVYSIEPFERDCSCPSILTYERVFGPQRTDE